MNHFILALTFFFLNSCSSYISQIHSEFDRNKEQNYRVPKSKNNFDFYRGRGSRSSSAFQSSRRRKRLSPNVKRNYIDKTQIKKRYKDYDLNDNAGDGSLWIDSQGSANQLFTQETRRKVGDIVVINVFSNLKNEITAELKRAFPAPRRASSKKAKKNTPKQGEKTKSTADATEKHDKISAIIVEEINKSHILLRGRKNLLFRNRKHLVEVQALISRRNISLDDTVNSGDILESEVNIVR